MAALRRSGEPRPVVVSDVIDDVFVSGSEVPLGAEVEVDVVLTPIGPTVEARGVVRAPWVGACRRCLKPAAGTAVGEVLELFEDPFVEGETYPLVHDEVDLEPLARETVVLELPQAPLCREDCLGLCPTCGVDRNESTCTCAPPLDPRWAVLDELRNPGPEES